MNLDQQIGDVIKELEAASSATRALRCDPRIICEEPEIYRAVAAADQKINFCIGWLTSLKGMSK
jgi:hypothetical protein